MTFIDQINWAAVFDRIYPDFFQMPSIRALPGDEHWDEMALGLDGFSADGLSIPIPANIRYGFYDGNVDSLRDAVGRVDKTWTALFHEDTRVLCAFDGDRIASFCMLEDMCEYEGLRIGGPGCVGTLPEYRKKGIGLKLVQTATEMLAREGYHLSYIHYTGVANWYARLGYRTVLQWNNRGLIGRDADQSS